MKTSDTSSKKRKVKPTKKQLQTFEHMRKAETLKEAMQAGGYSVSTSLKPKQNFTDSEGFKALVEQYKYDLTKAGFSTEMLAEIQMEGLFDQDAKVRLEYIKETKKDLGLTSTDQPQNPGRKITFEEFFEVDK